jgi:hypothetical protein
VKLYIYDKVTKEYKGTMDACLDPIKSKRLGREIIVIPPCCTLFPPVESTDKVNVFNTEKGIWELVEDNRGTLVYNKKNEVFVITELGPIPKEYSKEKHFILQEEKINKNSVVNEKYLKAYSEKIKAGKVMDNIGSLNKLKQLQENMSDETYATYNSTDGVPEILTKDEISYLYKYFYARSLLLPIKREEILKEIKLAKSKAQLEKVKIDFNVEKETETLAKKSIEDIDNYINGKLK